MFENISRGWKLGSEVRKLVFKDKSLFSYPILSAIISIIIAAALFIPMFFATQWGTANYVIVLFVYYLLVTFISTYMLVGMLLSFRAYAKGKPISIGQALSQANSYTVQIFEWAVFYSIIMMLLRALESRSRGIAGVVLSAVASFALSVAILFVIPVIIDQRAGPIKAIEGSVKFIKDNFGATFGGLLFSDLYSMMFTLGGVAILIVGVIAIAAVGAIAIGIAVIGIVLMVIGGLVGYMISNVFRLILYDYKLTGKLPAGIDAELIKGSVVSKKQGPSNGVL
ncbi:MAG: hypothetical protein KGH58_00745 [Candidatus Micrarchaeota archaeon]|nr:hypothetical protein [Candidatus Micrarchaeota archaeon]